MPDHSDKIMLLDPEGAGIDDPIGGSVDVYRNAARRIRACLEKRLEDIS